MTFARQKQEFSNQSIEPVGFALPFQVVKDEILHPKVVVSLGAWTELSCLLTAVAAEDRTPLLLHRDIPSASVSSSLWPLQAAAGVF